MKKVAILYICTGKYDVFWKDFYKSCEKYLLRKYKKQYFVFTDSDNIYNEENKDITKVFQENIGWPKNTLMRFKMFKKVENQLKDFDYIFFFNANILFIKEIGEEILPLTEDLVMVQHPGFFNKPRYKFPYERNRKSTAYISKGKGQFYVQGALNGGKSREFINLIDKLSRNVDIDMKNNIIALWHDESHLNKYILDKNVKILDPGYVYPEGWNLPFEIKILTRDKNKWGGHVNLRNVKKVSIINKVKGKCKLLIRYIIS